MNLKTFIPLSMFILEACQGSPAPTQKSLPPLGDGPQMCGGPDPSKETLEEIRASIRDTNRVLEECIMPAYGLYAATQTCDAPPSTCETNDK